MAHLEPVPPARASLFVKLAYWIAKRKLGRVPTPVGIMAHHAATLRATAAFELLTEKPTVLSLRLRELAVLKTATIIGCRFCIDIGASIAKTHGLEDDDLRALLAFEDSPRFTDGEKRVLAYAVAMTDAPMVVEKDLIDALERDLGAAGLVELTSSIAWENYRARFNHAMGAKEEGFSEGSLCLLPAAADGSLETVALVG